MNHRTLTIRNDEGLQARPAALLVQVANKYNSNIWIEMNSKRVNAKSIMGVLSLKLRMGDRFLIAAVGEDEDAAVAAIVHLIETGEANI